MAVTFGEHKRFILFLRKRQKESGLSYRDIARILGWNPSTVQVAFKEGVLSLSTLKTFELLRLLQVSPTEAAERMKLYGILPPNPKEAKVLEAAWMLYTMPDKDSEILFRQIESWYYQLERNETA